MKGTILTFKPFADAPEVATVDGPPDLPLLKAAIGGGYLEVVPRFNTIAHDGVRHRCVAFCDEDGKLKQLPVNRPATLLWNAAMLRSHGCGCDPDYLVGQIAVVFGDKEWMAAL